MRALPPLLLLAACYRSPAGPDASVAAPAAAPAGPAPTLAWTGHGFESTRLPAVSADGAAVLLGLEDNDGGRGYPNYRLELRDRRDATLATHPVLAVTEVEALQDASGDLRGMDDRIAEANRWLAAQHAARRFAPLAELEVETGDEIASAFRATGHGATLEWRAGRVTIAAGDGAQLLARDTPPAWGDQRRPRGSGGETCENPAFLGAAWIGLPQKLAVLLISYSGNDLCWEPSNAPHVVAW